MRCACYNIIMAELSVDLPGEPIPNGENAAMITTLAIHCLPNPLIKFQRNPARI